MIDAAILLRGTDGEIRIADDDGAILKVSNGGSTERIDVGGESMHRTGDERERFGSQFHDRAVEHALDCLGSDNEPEISGRIGLNTAEILFAGYESVRRRGRVDLPLRIDDDPLETMVENGDLTPEPAANGERT